MVPPAGQVGDARGSVWPVIGDRRSERGQPGPGAGAVVATVVESVIVVRHWAPPSPSNIWRFVVTCRRTVVGQSGDGLAEASWSTVRVHAPRVAWSGQRLLVRSRRWSVRGVAGADLDLR